MNNRLKVALTHDVDRTKKTYQHFTHLIKALGKLDFKNALYQITSFNESNQVYWNFDEILEIENEFNIKSTFFFLIESIPFNLFRISNWKLSLGRFDINEPRIISMINYLDENGWEVSLHGSYRSFNDLNLLNKEKSILENILKHPVIGIRQHYLNLNENTWAFQKQAGFLYDSSWGYNTKIGFKDNRVRLFNPFSDNFVVFPLAVMDFCYMNTPDRKKVLMELIKKCKEEDSILVVNWHNNNFDPHDFPGFRNSYKELIEICVDEDAEFNTLSFFYHNYKIE